jgi:uracil-DNA glycosylase family 4
MSTDPRDLAEHLRYYADLGVTGFSRERTWRARASSTVAGPAAPPHAGETVTGSAKESASGRTSADGFVLPAASVAPQVTGPARSRADAMAIVRADLGDCTRCKLHKDRTNLVFGVGDAEARLMFVGEGPGADEDQQGIPFVGRAGQLLTQIIKAMGLEREAVYIANVVKCRPPGNRNPEPDEIEQCEPFLMRQIDVIKPTVIVALGKFAAQTLLRTSEPISRLRGQFHRVGDIRVMPTFHPSYLLRNPAAKREVWEDMKRVMAALRDNEEMKTEK